MCLCVCVLERRQKTVSREKERELERDREREREKKYLKFWPPMKCASKFFMDCITFVLYCTRLSYEWQMMKCIFKKEKNMFIFQKLAAVAQW